MSYFLMYEYKLARKQVRKWVLEEKDWWTFQSEEKHMGQSQRLWEMIREQAMTKNNSICLFRKVKYTVSGGWVPLPSPLSSFHYNHYHHFHKYTCQDIYMTRQGWSLLPLLCNIVLEVIATTIREGNKRNPYWKRSKTLTVCKWYDTIHRKS